MTIPEIRNRWLLVLAICLGFFMIMLEAPGRAWRADR
jgi:hypothetical protein